MLQYPLASPDTAEEWRCVDDDNGENEGRALEVEVREPSDQDRLRSGGETSESPWLVALLADTAEEWWCADDDNGANEGRVLEVEVREPSDQVRLRSGGETSESPWLVALLAGGRGAARELEAWFSGIVCLMLCSARLCPSRRGSTVAENGFRVRKVYYKTTTRRGKR